MSLGQLEKNASNYPYRRAPTHDAEGAEVEKAQRFVCVPEKRKKIHLTRVCEGSSSGGSCSRGVPGTRGSPPRWKPLDGARCLGRAAGSLRSPAGGRPRRTVACSFLAGVRVPDPVPPSAGALSHEVATGSGSSLLQAHREAGSKDTLLPYSVVLHSGARGLGGVCGKRLHHVAYLFIVKSLCPPVNFPLTQSRTR